MIKMADKILEDSLIVEMEDWFTFPLVKIVYKFTHLFVKIVDMISTQSEPKLFRGQLHRKYIITFKL